MSEAALLVMAQSQSWGSQIADKVIFHMGGAPLAEYNASED